MSEALPQDLSIVQVESNFRLAELLASQSCKDDLSPSINSRPQEEILAFLRDRLKFLNKAVQVGLLERYIRICRKSSTNYPPLPITGIKACLYIIKVSTELTDTSIKEKLAIVIESWRLILEQEIGPALAGSQSVWTCKALCQLTGRAEASTDPTIDNSAKRKRSQDNLNEDYDKFTPSSSPPPQRCRTSSSRVPETMALQDSPRHLLVNTISGSEDISKEVAVVTNPSTSESNELISVKTPTNKDLAMSASTDSPKQVEPPPIQTSSSASAPHQQITQAISRPLLLCSSGNTPVLPQSKVLTPLCNTYLSQAPSESQAPAASQGQISRVPQNINQEFKTPTSTAHVTTRQHDDVSQTVLVPNVPSADPVTLAQLKHWQHSFSRLDARITELLETMPLTPVIPFSNTFYKPNPYSPGFQWTSRSLSSYVDPPGLSITNIPLIATFRPQFEPQSPPIKSTTPCSSTNLATSRIHAEQSLTIISPIPHVVQDSVTHGKLPTPTPLGALSLPPAQLRPTIEPTPSDSLACSNQGSSIPPSLPNSGQLSQHVFAEPQPIFNVTHAQKMKFVDTYRRVDASGKAKLEATLRKNKLWDVLAPLLTPTAIETPSSTTPQITSPPRQPHVNATSTPPDLTVVQPSSSTPKPPITPTKPSSASPIIKSMNVPILVSPEQPVACTAGSESSNGISESAKPQPTPNALHAAYINGAVHFKESLLDPVLTKMILAMLAAEPQGTNVLLAAFETLGIRNRDAILTHLKALAFSVDGNNNVWQLRPQAGATSPSRVLHAPSSIASHVQPTPKPADSTTTRTPQPKEIHPMPTYLLPKDNTEMLIDPSLQLPETLSSTSLLAPDPPIPQQTRQSQAANGLSQDSREKTIQSTTKMGRAMTEDAEEIEVVQIVDLKKTNKSESMSTRGSERVTSDYPAMKKGILVSGLEDQRLASVSDLEIKKEVSNGRCGDTPVDERTSSLKKSSRKSQALKDIEDRLHFNILDDGLPGFPDVDPAVQIQGCSARILARYPTDQQMPPIRTFVPLLKKARP